MTAQKKNELEDPATWWSKKFKVVLVWNPKDQSTYEVRSKIFETLSKDQHRLEKDIYFLVVEKEKIAKNQLVRAHVGNRSLPRLLFFVDKEVMANSSVSDPQSLIKFLTAVKAHKQKHTPEQKLMSKAQDKTTEERSVRVLSTIAKANKSKDAQPKLSLAERRARARKQMLATLQPSAETKVTAANQKRVILPQPQRPPPVERARPSRPRPPSVARPGTRTKKPPKSAGCVIQ